MAEPVDRDGQIAALTARVTALEAARDRVYLYVCALAVLISLFAVLISL